MKISDLYESNTPLTLYHLTNEPRFELKQDFTPEDNSISIFGRHDINGIYLTDQHGVGNWLLGKGYWRPFVVEISADPSVKELDRVGRWQGEIFVESENFNLLKVNRVIPIDAFAREQYEGANGWIEEALGIEFDTGNPIPEQVGNIPLRPGYKYNKDTRTMPEAEVQALLKHFEAGVKIIHKWGGA